MSEETKTNEPVKQEGDFKIKKRKPKNLGLETKNNNITKVDLSKAEATGEIMPDVVKINIPADALKTEEDAIQVGETTKVDVEEQTGDSARVDEQIPEPKQVVEEVSPIQEITEEDKQEVSQISKDIAEAKRDEKVLGKP